MFFLFALVTTVLAGDVQDGDIIFQTTLSSQSEAIRLATDSPYTHVGIITIQDNEPMVYEAIGPVIATPLKRWIQRGQGGQYLLMRPKKPLTKSQIQAMEAVGQRHRGKSYDLRFEWSDQKMYCSELVWKIYKEGAGIRLAKPQPMDSYRLSHPTVQALLRSRWGSDVRWKEPMVAPSDLAASPKLGVVVDTYRH
jgi:hypothetical protein